MVLVGKACAVVVRPGSSGLELLVFRHPLAGMQLVKGTIESGESAAVAAIRELVEEAGGRELNNGVVLGTDTHIARHQVWTFVLLPTGPLPDHWDHDAADDGGHCFSFSWIALDAPLGDDWHPVFRRAIASLQRLLA